MAQVVVMPALGNTVESCLVTAWSVAVGETVEPDTVLCDIETDKSAMEIPAGVSGVVLALLAAEGDEVPVKAPLLIVGAPGESTEEALAAAGLAPAVTGEGGEVQEATQLPVKSERDERGAQQQADRPAVTTESVAHTNEALAAATSDTADGTPFRASPRARAAASRAGIALDSIGEGSGPLGRVLERDVEMSLAGSHPTAGARGQELRGVPGTGIGGRVTYADTLGAPVPLSHLVTLVEPAAAIDVTDDAKAPFVDTPLRGVRKLIAERMLRALATSAQLTYTATARAEAMLALRSRFKGAAPDLGYGGITLGDLVCFATVQVLAHHPHLNAHLLEGTLRTFRAVHLGLAVDTPRGLLVPTIRNADALSLRELSKATKELAAECQSGRIDPELLTGATFTVSNLGSFGIESFTPIINVPQTGILGVDAIVTRAVMNDDGTVGAERRIGLSLTADHQVVDGADAARFLRDLTIAIENIDLTAMG